MALPRQMDARHRLRPTATAPAVPHMLSRRLHATLEDAGFAGKSGGHLRAG